MSEALAATQTAPFVPGSVLAERYELRGLLGEGGMGTVYRAYDRELDEEVALKVLHREVAADAAALTRFRREVKLARRVTHRNVARTFDLGAHEGTRFLTMEIIAGESLGALARRAPLQLPEALRVAAEIARGLAAAHVVGVVHRDLKPENVMIADDRVVLTDFGIARVADGGGAADVMRTGMVVGTPAYMSPEQLENRAIDGRTDVYALGSILFELLTGRAPFVGDSAFSLAAQRMTADAPDVRTLAPAAPDGVAALVREMLARRKEDRPDAQAVLDRLESLRGNQVSAGHAMMKLPTLASDTFASLGAPRTVLVEALEASGEAKELAATLSRALIDALVESRVAQVVTGGEAGADLVVQGTLHGSGERVRARLRVLGRKGAPVWAGHVDGAATSTLDFEDAVVEAVTVAVRARTEGEPGPADPALREDYEKARVELAGFALPRVRNAVALLEGIEARKPGDAHVRALLARALHSQWAQLGGRDRALVARSEELALRALDAEPTLANAHHVIAQIRGDDGELVAALRAETECLRHDPRNAEAHATLGWWMAQALHVREGMRRLELAARFAFNDSYVYFARIHVLAMTGDEGGARTLLAEMAARFGELAAAVLRSRAAVWWNDRDLARSTAETIEQAKAGAAWDGAAGLMRIFVSGTFDDEAPGALAGLVDKGVARRRRTMMHCIAADFYAAMGQLDLALAEVEAFARLPSLDLLWMDGSPPLAPLRAEPRFAEARAIVSARCAELWGSVGSWPD